MKTNQKNDKNNTKEAENKTETTQDFIEIYGAREHNLKNIDIKIPRHQLVVITGVSGSGKSSLTFDTIYAEGQRRYMESFSSYARSFLGDMQRPDVDKINGLSPVISIEQKTTTRNPRSTVGTTTELYDFLRLLYARAAIPYSYNTGEKMAKQSQEQIIDEILKKYENKKVVILSPIIKSRKGNHKEIFAQYRKMGFTKMRVNEEIIDIENTPTLDRYKIHNIELVIDRIIPTYEDIHRLTKSVETAMKYGEGFIGLIYENAYFTYSKVMACPTTGISYDEPAPNSFSFNSPAGWCPTCQGLGHIEDISETSIIPDKDLSISRGGIAPLGEYKETWIFFQLEALLKQYKLSLTTPIKKFPEELYQELFHGSTKPLTVKKDRYKQAYNTQFEGIINYLKRHQDHDSEKAQNLIEDFIETKICPDCNGAKLKKESLHFFLGEENKKNIYNVSLLNLKNLKIWLDETEKTFDTRQQAIATPILKEIRQRLDLILEIGLDYLSLSRQLRTLSGGETQRIRLATQIGTQLTGVLYILDEPSIGLHARDNEKLIKSLQNLRDLGNSVLVVEHDKDMMLEADCLIDIGKGAGIHGGKVVAIGTPKEVLKQDTLTAQYLNGKKEISIPTERRKGSGNTLTIKGATGHNLKNVTLHLPLGKMICVTGVSGSGKSSLIHNTLYPILNRYFFRAKKLPLPYDSIEGLEHIDKVIEVDQSPIGRTPRSNPSTYVGFFTEIRNLFSQLPEAKIRGYKTGRFSFNVKGGRCEECQGGGMKLIEMEFLPDVYVECQSCKGKRYNRETLEVRFKNKSISDILDMTVNQAVVFFENQPLIKRKIETLKEVGLGYITLGQSSTSLSGGEAQRIKLATELSRKDTGKTFYILDEPTTGLHFEDINVLLGVLQKLVDKGNTMLIIEHNMDVIKVADHIVDMGKEGGDKGGKILFEGTPEQLILNKESYTAKFLKMEFKNADKSKK